MKVVFNHFEANENIPVYDYIRNRKMAKYYNREAQAAFVSIGMLLKNLTLEYSTSLYYAVGIIEHEEFNINKIAIHSVDESGQFSNKSFIEKGMMQISPLTQFKVLYNMTLCFISIEYNLHGDNAAIYSSAKGLLNYALHSDNTENILIGTGKIYADGSVESGFAFASQVEINDLWRLPQFNSDTEAIELFKYLKQQN